MVLEKSSGRLYDLLGFAFDIYYVASPEDLTKIKTLSREDGEIKFIWDSNFS